MKKTVLLIDDDPFIRDLVGTKLSTKFFDPIVVATAEEGFKAVAKKTPDVILLDLDLPGVHGLEVLYKLKRSKKTKHIPVIIFSNNDAPEVQESTINLGADDFFLKISVDLNELEQRIAAVLG